MIIKSYIIISYGAIGRGWSTLNTRENGKEKYIIIKNNIDYHF